MTSEEIGKMLIENGFVIGDGEDIIGKTWHYPNLNRVFKFGKYKIFCALYIDKNNDCLKDITDIYDVMKGKYILEEYMYVLHINKHIKKLDSNELLKIITGQKELYNKMNIIIKQNNVNEKLQLIEEDFV